MNTEQIVRAMCWAFLLALMGGAMLMLGFVFIASLSGLVLLLLGAVSTVYGLHILPVEQVL